jgi:ketosteroid isomerase-like protein
MWMNAYNSKDASNLSPLYTEDARYVSGHVNGLVADGREAVLAYMQQGMCGGDRPEFAGIKESERGVADRAAYDCRLD